MNNKHSGEYIGGIVGNLVFGYLAWRLPDWWPGLVTTGYSAALWVVLLAAGVQALGNLIWLINDEPWFKALVDVFMQAASLASSATLYYIMPFNFEFFSASRTAESIVRWALIVCIIVTAVMLFVRLAQTIIYLLAPRDTRHR